MTSLFDPSVSAQLVLVLGHFLWQGFAIGVVALVAGGIWQRRSPVLRYRIYVASLAAMAACPIITYSMLPAPALSVMTSTEVETPVDLARSSAPQYGSVIPKRTVSESSSATSADPATASSAFDWRRTAPWIVGVYATGVLLMLARLAVGLGGGRRLRRRAQQVDGGELFDLLRERSRQLGLRAAPALAWCSDVAVPTVVGALRPMILLPATMATGVPTDQLAAILGHELAHIRRWDPIVNVLQCLIEALLFFHPMVWVVSRQIRRERENCCDDMVVGLGVSPIQYANTLVEIAGRALAAPHVAPLGSAALYSSGQPSELSGRVRRLLGVESRETQRLNRPGFLVASGALILLAAAGLATLRADEASADDSPNPARVQLPNGTVVELLGVCGNWQDKQTPWWRADGLSIERPAFDEDGESWVKTDAKSVERSFVLRAAPFPQGAVHRASVLQFGHAGGGTIHNGVLTVPMLSSVPKDRKTATVQLGFTETDWRKVTYVDVKRGAWNHNGIWLEIGEVEPADETTGWKDAASLWTLHTPRDPDGRGPRYRAIAIDDEGNEHQSGKQSTSRNDDETLKHKFVFSLAPDKISGIRVESVAFRYWVTFENISLEPGLETKVVTRIEAPEQPGVSTNTNSEAINATPASSLRMRSPFGIPLVVAGEDTPSDDRLIAFAVSHGWRDGNRVETHLVVHSDGSAIVPADHRNRECQITLTPKQLDELVHSIESAGFFDLPQAIGEDNENGPSILGVRLRRGDRHHEVLLGSTRADSTDLNLVTFREVTGLLWKMQSLVRAGGPDEVARYLGVANAALLREFPDVQPLSAADLLSAEHFLSGRRVVDFLRQDPLSARVRVEQTRTGETQALNVSANGRSVDVEVPPVVRGIDLAKVPAAKRFEAGVYEPYIETETGLGQTWYRPMPGFVGFELDEFSFHLWHHPERGVFYIEHNERGKIYGPIEADPFQALTPPPQKPDKSA